jgi:hypothetical protein
LVELLADGQGQPGDLASAAAAGGLNLAAKFEKAGKIKEETVRSQISTGYKSMDAQNQ